MGKRKSARTFGNLTRCIPLLIRLCSSARASDVVNAQDLIGKATSAMQADWGADYMPIAIDDKPFSADQQKLELAKLR